LFGSHAAEVAGTIGSGRTDGGLGVIAIDSGQNWGVASTELVHALMDEHVLAIVALDRDAAHLAEQLSLKTFVPVVALSDDKALTSTNVPWIFRLPGSTGAADAMRLVTEAARMSGENPEKLRDLLASGTMVAGVRFLSTGEPAR
jgi:branched-chain amino acid transport system substrate-binding protein